MSGGSNGIEFVGVLQIAFIVLKLCKVIAWSWWVVMLPAIINTIILVIVAVVVIWAHRL